MKTKKHQSVALTIVIMLFMWMAIASGMQAFKCPELSQTERFLLLPNSFVLDFKYCD